MSNQNIDSTDPTLTKLLDVSADLASKEAQLQAQLQEVQEKRKSLETVISLFSPEALASSDQVTSATAIEEQTTSPTLELDTASNNGSATTKSQESSSPAAAPSRRRPRSTNTNRSTAQRTKGKQGKGRSFSGSFKESWRPYLQDEFLDSTSLPDIVTTVLERHQGQVLSARNIMNSIFEDDMPQTDYQKVHHRLLTILSKGVKDERWVRSNKGEYSIPA